MPIVAQRLLRVLGRRQICAKLSTLGAVCAALLVGAAVPVVPLQPTCWDESIWSVFNPFGGVSGKMSKTFREAYEETLRFYGVRFISVGGNILVTVPTWLDRDYMMNMSNKAVRRVLAVRTGRDPEKAESLVGEKLGIADFDDVHPGRWPPCSGVRKLAIRGGEWAGDLPGQPR